MWAPDPFNAEAANPRPWLVVSGQSLPYPDEESIRIPSDAWVVGEPDDQSFVLPWSVATLKDELHVVGVQGEVTATFVERVTTATAEYLQAGE